MAPAFALMPTVLPSIVNAPELISTTPVVLTVSVPSNTVAPVTFIVPLISNNAVGAVVPIPTYPLESTIIRSAIVPSLLSTLSGSK